MKKSMLLALLLAACMIAGCGSSGAAPAEPAAPAETAAPTVPEEPETVVRYTLPWDDPVDMELCYQGDHMVYARFNGVDDLDPENGKVTLAKTGSDSADIVIEWNYGEVHTIHVENGELDTLSYQGHWEDNYTENWESLPDASNAAYTGSGIWMDTYTKDGVRLSSHSVADYTRTENGSHWVGDNTEYYDRNGQVIKTDNCTINDNGTYYREIFTYSAGTLMEKRIESTDFFTLDEGADVRGWYKDITEEKLIHVPGLSFRGEDVVTGTIREGRLLLGTAESEEPSEEITSESNARLWIPEYRWTGSFREHQYSFDKDTNTWTCFKWEYLPRDVLDAYPLWEEPVTFETAREITRGSCYNDFAFGINTGSGWRWDDSVTNKDIQEMLLEDNRLEAAMFRGVRLANQPGKTQEGLDYLERVFSAGYLTAAYESGVIYFDKKDYTSSSDWYEKVYDIGYDIDPVAIGYRFESEARKYDLAAHWYEKAYDAGFAAGALDLGWLYANGLMPADNAGETALEWFVKAFETHDGTMGECYGALSAGGLYLNDALGEPDTDKAIEWYQKAYDAGFADGAYNAAALFHNGEYVEQDYEKAAQWYEKAYALGSGAAATNLGNLYLNGRLGEADEAKAMEWYDKALTAANPDSNAALYAGYYYAPFTAGSTNDPAAALKWYLRGAEQGNAGCMLGASICYRHVDDDSSEPNPEKQAYWQQMYNENK